MSHQDAIYTRVGIVRRVQKPFGIKIYDRCRRPIKPESEIDIEWEGHTKCVLFAYKAISVIVPWLVGTEPNVTGTTAFYYYIYMYVHIEFRP